MTAAAKKGIFLGALALVIAAALGVCALLGREQGHTFEACVVQADEHALLVAPTGGGVLGTAGLSGARLLDAGGSPAAAEDFAPGQVVLVTTREDYVLLSYPVIYPDVMKIQQTGEYRPEFAAEQWAAYEALFGAP